MINPFQMPSQRAPKQSRVLANRIWLWTGATVAVATAFTAAFFMIPASWMPAPLSQLHPPSATPQIIFSVQGGLAQQDARTLYRKALSDLESGNYESALTAFKTLESSYPGLQDMLWLHQAEAYAGQGNEWAVQKKLRHLLDQHFDSPLKAIALYRVGQSQFRGNDWKAAQKTFENVRRLHPGSPYATGSLYYLGAILARDEKSREDGIARLTTYLKECPDCVFSGESADLLEKFLPNPTQEEHALLGLAQAATSRDLQKAMAHLAKGTPTKTWLALGQSQIRAGQTQAGLKTLINGLPHADSTETARIAIDALLAHTPAGEKQVTLLKDLANAQLQTGGDYILWKLAEADSKQAKAYYEMLVQQYPQGDYAPESHWRLLWPLITSGNGSTYIGQAQQYISQYPYARSAPKALFWIGKLQEKSNPSEATKIYERLTRQYPTNYYAFRAKGRLSVLAYGKQDPGWPTLSARRDYPSRNTELDTLDIFPPAEKFAAGELGIIIRNQAKELQQIGASDDTKLLVSETIGQVPPTVESWASQISGDRAKGLRVIRDALEQQAKEQLIGKKTNQSLMPKADELKLLYPIYFAGYINQAGQKNKVDPYLIQSLMREESYFNEFAISSSNARGLMQLLPSTAKEVAGWEKLPSFGTNDLFTPEVNIQLGSRYLAHLHSLFNQNSMPSVGAYNGGPNAMKRWVQNSAHLSNDPDMFVELIPYEQSRDYIKKVFASYWNYTRLYSHSPI